jgi:hypothetical protein
MKSLITLLIATVITLTSFATTKPYTNTNYNVAPVAALTIKLTAAGKVSINWTATVETTTTVYHIQKSVDGGTSFKTIAILMGETNDSYSFKDSIKELTGNVTYRVVTVDNNTTVNTVSQTVVIM